MPIKKRKTTARKKGLQPEASVQKAVVEYIKLRYPKVRYCASLGGIRTSFKQAVVAKATGYVKGFPDLQICYPTNEYAGLFLELKANKKCYPSKEQKEWIAYLNDVGYYAEVTKGFDQTIEVIDNYLKDYEH